MILMNKIIMSIGLISLTAFSHELPPALVETHAVEVGALTLEGQGGVSGEHARLLGVDVVPADHGAVTDVDC